MNILAINPGSTSQKVALFDDDRLIFEATDRYSAEELAPFATVADQKDFRLQGVLKLLREKGVEVSSIDAVVGRGGLMHPVEGGTYRVNDRMCEDLSAAIYGSHASNLGGLLAREIARQAGHDQAFIVDPVVVDEMDEVARITGLTQVKRRSCFHALNQKAIARRIAAERGVRYEDLNLVIAHLGGGITVGAHKKGRVIDVTNGLDGEGPFSPERSGVLPTGPMLELAFSGQYTKAEMYKMLAGRGGLVSLLGTTDMREVERRYLEGDAQVVPVFEAMAYNVAKEMGGKAVALEGKVDALVLTGGIAYCKPFVELVTKKVQFIAPVLVYPGEDELGALAQGALRVMKGQEEPKEYE